MGKDCFPSVRPFRFSLSLELGVQIMTLLADNRLAIARAHFVICCAASRAHNELAGAALDTYGDHGPLISGVVRDHFPEPIKDELRRLARLVSEWSDSAYAARPKRVRLDTMRSLARDVATRDGSGYYGPQARRESRS
jgi:hypothetical protein